MMNLIQNRKTKVSPIEQEPAISKIDEWGIQLKAWQCPYRDYSSAAEGICAIFCGLAPHPCLIEHCPLVANTT
jgi:hypothetical protein